MVVLRSDHVDLAWGPAAQARRHQFAHARELVAVGRETRAGAPTLFGVDVVALRRVLRRHGFAGV